jgi:hypothetical protein
VGVADVEEGRVDALLDHRLAVHQRHAEPILVDRKRGVDRFDGDADVVDGRQLHPGQVTCARARAEFAHSTRSRRGFGE